VTTRRRRAVTDGPPVGWLALADVKTQLAIDGTDGADDVLIQACIDAAEPEVTRARPDAWSETSTPADYPDAYRGGVMLAARLVRRRNSPAGIESFGESVTYVAAYDPDLDRFMRRGRYRLPGVG
jgi:Phage gp6-like head-tail connector protein